MRMKGISKVNVVSVVEPYLIGDGLSDLFIFF